MSPVKKRLFMWRLGSRTSEGKSVWLLANLLAQRHKAVCVELWRRGRKRTAPDMKSGSELGGRNVAAERLVMEMSPFRKQPHDEYYSCSGFRREASGGTLA